MEADVALVGRRARLRILVAEDDPVNRRVLRVMLGRRGYEITLVSDGRAALDAARSDTCDLLITDVHMPEMDGPEVAAAIREDEKTLGTHLNIVAMTGSAEDSDIERCLGAGMDGYMSKPIELETLYRLVEGLVHGREGHAGTVGGTPGDEAGARYLPVHDDGVDKPSRAS